MLKLARNALAELLNMISEHLISFHFIKKLYELQELDLKLANKLNYNHSYFKNKKMNVSLAAQTLSNAVANAIDFLRKSGEKDFINSEATTYFIRIIDRFFDIMNTRSSFGTGFKSLMMKNNL